MGKKSDWYGKRSTQAILNDIVIAIDGEITYGDSWDIKPENEAVFAEVKELLDEYHYMRQQDAA